MFDCTKLVCVVRTSVFYCLCHATCFFLCVLYKGFVNSNQESPYNLALKLRYSALVGQELIALMFANERESATIFCMKLKCSTIWHYDVLLTP